MKHLSKFVIAAIVLAFGMLAVSSVFAAGPTGTSPNDPQMVPTGAQTIAPNTTQWFYFDYAVDSTTAGRGARFASKASVAIDANGMNGLQFAIYTPTQAKSWLSDPTTSPVGRGTPYMDTSYDVIMRDLYWAGAFNSSGRYFVAVTNNAADADFISSDGDRRYGNALSAGCTNTHADAVRAGHGNAGAGRIDSRQDSF